MAPEHLFPLHALEELYLVSGLERNDSLLPGLYHRHVPADTLRPGRHRDHVNAEHLNLEGFLNSLFRNFMKGYAFCFGTRL